MKFYNKFIAVGLGLAISFSATNIGYMWFTDSNKLENNSISFGELYDRYIKTNAIIGNIMGNDRKCLKIDLPDDIKKKVVSIVPNSYSGTGRFDKTSPRAVVLGQNIMHIHSQGSFSNSDIEYNEEYITLTFRVQTSLVTSELRKYRIKFIKPDPNDTNKLQAHWYLISTSKLDNESDDENINPDENSGAVTLPELEEENSQPEIPETGEPDNPNPEQPIDPEQPTSPDSENNNENENNNNNETQLPVPDNGQTIPEQVEITPENEAVTLEID